MKNLDGRKFYIHYPQAEIVTVREMNYQGIYCQAGDLKVECFLSMETLDAMKFGQTLVLN